MATIYYAIDFTRSGDRGFAISLLRELIERLGEDDMVSVLFYGIRSYPLIDPVPAAALDIEDLADQAVMVPAIEGPSEPYRVIRETVTRALELGSNEPHVIIYWSASRQPRVPLWLQAIYAENHGVCWKLVIDRPSPPRWMPRVLGVYMDRLYTVRRNTALHRLAARLLEPCREGKGTQSK